jgi:hypothetical protein
MGIVAPSADRVAVDMGLGEIGMDRERPGVLPDRLLGVVPQNSNRILTTTTGRTFKNIMRSRLASVGDPIFRNCHMRRQIAEGGAALRRAHAKDPERIRGFCDEGLTTIEHMSNPVGL